MRACCLRVTSKSRSNNAPMCSQASPCSDLGRGLRLRERSRAMAAMITEIDENEQGPGTRNQERGPAARNQSRRHRGQAVQHCKPWTFVRQSQMSQKEAMQCSLKWMKICRDPGPGNEGLRTRTKSDAQGPETRNKNKLIRESYIYCEFAILCRPTGDAVITVTCFSDKADRGPLRPFPNWQ